MTEEKAPRRNAEESETPEGWSYDAALEQAEKCKSLEDLQGVADSCAWMTSQQNMLLKTAILAFYNGGAIPVPSREKIPSAEKALEEQRGEQEARAIAGDATRTMDDVLADELRQALRMNQVQLHSQLGLSQQVSDMREEITALLIDRIKNLPKFAPPPSAAG
ncbi:hypothetical protein [Streptomyces platensis]|uniref:hypothetical protein n=1 Tax=Streptomyces platensis TaxID=58346 RepID=UPI003334785C